MNVKLSVEREFLAAVWDPDHDISNLVINHYQLIMRVITRTTDQRDINTAMDRVYYFIDQTLSNTVFVGSMHGDAATMLDFMGLNVTTVPHEPVDQIIGMMLFCKFRAIMEQRVDIESLEINSANGHRVGYLHQQDEPLGPLAVAGWWHDADVRHHDMDHGSSDAVIDIQPDSWRQLQLDWQRETSTATTVVYADFGKNHADQ